MEDPALEAALQTQVISEVNEKEVASIEQNSVPKVSSDTFDQNIVDFEIDDPANPLNWPVWRKWSIVWCTATMFMLANFGTITIVPAVPQVMQEFKVTNQLYTTFLVTIWELGEVLGPLFVGPLSEMYGRTPVYHGGNVLFILCSTGAALSTNMAMLIVFRFLNGFVIASVTLGPSIVGDLFRKEERGTAMSIAIAFPLMGPFVAPIVGSYIADAKGWRWTIWIVVILVGAVTCVACVVFRETYKVKLLQLKTERLRKSTGNERLKSRYDHAAKSNTWRISLARPIKMLFLSPIVFIISFCTALIYGLSYLILTTLTTVMEDTYGFGQGPVGVAFLGRVPVGNIAGMLLYGAVSDRYIKYRESKEGYLKPEHRLPLMLLGAIVLPAGLFLYGWSAENHIHWIVPWIGTAVVGFSMLLSILPTENYLVDIYDTHGASCYSRRRRASGSVCGSVPVGRSTVISSSWIGVGKLVIGFCVYGIYTCACGTDGVWGES